MKKFLLAGFCAALTAAALQPGTAMKPTSVMPEESDQVVAKVLEKYSGIFRKCSGVESVRKEVISEFDPATNTLRSVSEVTMKRKDYFYKSPEVEVLTYKKDGKELEPSKFRITKVMPFYPFFDDKGRENYRITAAEKIHHNGKNCYRIQVDPRKQTSRHFKGNVYVTVKDMEIIHLEGTMAKLDFPIMEFSLALVIKVIDDVWVTQSGEIRVRVSVPLFYPDTLLVSTLTTLDYRLIQ